MTTPADLEHLRDGLKRKLSEADIVAQAHKIKDRVIREEWTQLIGKRHPGDEIWEYAWIAEPRANMSASYSLGWCLLRGDRIVDAYMHSTS
ncbi:hypothetical protein [Lysobacter silvisoli]|uniref:Uncharacterized protein n=1 Tax=Lysobacter silvisoli TaxID=2293254 RepID=A0A371K594_9GAMM|nr:hypothetical protein [Lysobacter silvisoli]RDZ29032.1 hypothetical protein DX914_08010 [Lysobacter silvisoli]